jgi:hypothetical protein
MPPPRNAVESASTKWRNTRLNQFNRKRAEWKASELKRIENEERRRRESMEAYAKKQANAAARRAAAAKAAAMVASWPKSPRAVVKGRFVLENNEPLQRKPAVRQNRKSGPRPHSPRRRLLQQRFVHSLQSAILNEQLKNVVNALKAELSKAARSPIRYSNGGYKVSKESRFKVYN